MKSFKKRALRRIFGSKKEEVIGYWRNCTVGTFKTCTHCRVSLGKSNQGGSDRQGICHKDMGKWKYSFTVY
jgi:hypothetical protein